MRLLVVRRLAPLAACTLLLLTACGGAGEANPEKIGPRGVDELVIPTPDPDPDDFVEDVDNPWLPLAPGTVWTYDVTGTLATRLEARVEEDRETVDGISCVVLSWTSTDADGEVVQRGTQYFAQDRLGNVWLFGEVGDQLQQTDEPDPPSWRAGELGAEAGVAMLASPRVGDGYFRQVAGNDADRATVLAVDDERTVPAGTFGGLLVTEDTSTLELSDVPEPRTVHRYYAEGVGLVEEETTAGGSQRLVLSEVVTPGD